MTRLLLRKQNGWKALSNEETSVSGSAQTGESASKMFALADEQPPANLYPGEMVSHFTKSYIVLSTVGV